jgi:hypothetical protein
MDKIISAGMQLPKLENNSIHRLYVVAENNYKEGYSMYTKGNHIEAFVLLMRFTKLFELINIHTDRYISCSRYNSIKRNFGKSINYLETIKPLLEIKYKSPLLQQLLPNVPNRSIEFDKVVGENRHLRIEEEGHRREMEETLLRRWENFKKSIPKLEPPKLVSKTTDDFKDGVDLIYKNKDGRPFDSLMMLAMHLKLRNRTIVDVPGDNNCQFHAVADQLVQIGITGWTAIKLRQKAVKWLQDNEKRPMDDGNVGEPTYLKDAVGVDDWIGYVNKMRIHDETWGDEATLLAFAALFRISIVVVSSLPGNYTHEVKPPQFWNIDHKGTIYLGHYHEFHYTSTKVI